MRHLINEKGFSLTELMLAMTILAVGLLALAQMQIMALHGTASSKQFSTATNLARERIEGAKITGIYVVVGATVNIKDNLLLNDHNAANNDEEDFAPAITTATDIIADIEFDGIEVLQQDPDTGIISNLCSRRSPNNCDTFINAGEWDFVRIVNVKNIPPGSSDGTSIMKDINVIVLWEERDRTRSVNLRTVVARKDDDFF
jgi:prepilin-type N-terminal cleavage/methylation domain-containing protein